MLSEIGSLDETYSYDLQGVWITNFISMVVHRKVFTTHIKIELIGKLRN